MFSQLEAADSGKQSTGPLDVTVEQSLPPASSSNCETAIRNNRYHVTNKPYSVFTHKEKWLIVVLASCAAIFRRVRYLYCICVVYSADVCSLGSHISPLTASIYFPAIPVISRDFHKSVELINLTVTMYMVMQGLCTPQPL